MRIALDATHAAGTGLTGVGVYSREIVFGLARQHPEARYRLCFRTQRLMRALRQTWPEGVSVLPLLDSWIPPHDLFHGLSQRLPRKRPRRAVTTFHDLFVLTGDYSSPEFRDRFAMQARRAAEGSDLILCVSAFTASQVELLLNIPPSRLRVIPHGVRPPARVAPIASREPMILSVGSLQTRKNTARLVDAFNHTLPGWKLVLAGSAGYGAEGILELIRTCPRSADIEVTGYVDDTHLAALYQRASIFAFPSLDEGFGIPVIEAMAAGVPVVTSSTSALAEVAGAAAVLVDPWRTGDITAALESLMASSSEREKYAEIGREHAASFPWERAVESTWKAYSELL